METIKSIAYILGGSRFKSHHSGMETVTEVSEFSDEDALNRTIVGWKLQDLLNLG